MVVSGWYDCSDVFGFQTLCFGLPVSGTPTADIATRLSLSSTLSSRPILLRKSSNSPTSSRPWRPSFRIQVSGTLLKDLSDFNTPSLS